MLMISAKLMAKKITAHEKKNKFKNSYIVLKLIYFMLYFKFEIKKT